MLAFPSPFDHTFLTFESEVSFTSPPSQNVRTPEAVIFGLSGKGDVTTFIVILSEVASQPYTFRVVTKYSPPAVTGNLSLVAPPFHLMFSEVLEINVAVFPRQTGLLPSKEIVGRFG